MQGLRLDRYGAIAVHAAAADDASLQCSPALLAPCVSHDADGAARSPGQAFALAMLTAQYATGRNDKHVALQCVHTLQHVDHCGQGHHGRSPLPGQSLSRAAKMQGKVTAAPGPAGRGRPGWAGRYADKPAAQSSKYTSHMHLPQLEGEDPGGQAAIPDNTAAQSSKYRSQPHHTQSYPDALAAMPRNQTAGL